MIVNPKEIQQIIKEEALRLKKRMMLESEKAAILKKLQEMEQHEMYEDAPMPGEAPVGAAPAGDVQIKPEVISTIQNNAKALMSKLTPEQMAQVQQELSQAGLLGASPEKVEAKVDQIMPMNEATISEGWDKNKMYKALIAGGIGAVAAGIVIAAIGGLATEQLSNLAQWTNVDAINPGNVVYGGLITAALGVVSTVVGATKARFEEGEIEEGFGDMFGKAKTAIFGDPEQKFIADSNQLRTAWRKQGFRLRDQAQWDEIMAAARADKFRGKLGTTPDKGLRYRPSTELKVSGMPGHTFGSAE